MTLTLEGLKLKIFQEIEDLFDGPRHNWSIYGELANTQQFKFKGLIIFLGKNFSHEIIQHNEPLLL